MNSHLTDQVKIHEEASNVIEVINLEEILDDYGEIAYVGSFALEVMVLRDIDLNLFIESDSEIEEAFWKIAKTFSKNEYTSLVLISDNLDGHEENRPVSMYLGLKVKYRGETWKFDIRVMKREHDASSSYIKSVKSLMSDEKREVILEIKSKLSNHPLYGKKFGGFHIYEAVLKDGVRDVEEFLEKVGEGV